MPYSELIKNFARIRDYMREFYVYGFKSREEYDQKSSRSYDNERRRIESYLGDYMFFRQTTEGKHVFLTIDSRSASHNPLYAALKAKSFTAKDITLHFILLDILHSPRTSLTVQQIAIIIDADYLACFETPLAFDESTLRKKLQEYTRLGILHTEKQGRQTLYSRNRAFDLTSWTDALSYYSEAGPLGVVGSFLLDKVEHPPVNFAFKHHYITHALESEILCRLLEAISEKRVVTLSTIRSRDGTHKNWDVVPLKIFVSTQTGRRYLLGYCLPLRHIQSYRLDFITQVIPGEASPQFDVLKQRLAAMQEHMWGVRCQHSGSSLEHVEFMVHIGDTEEYIAKRLEREKRCGSVERLDRNTVMFRADVYDSGELLPWIRTFIGRIVQMNFSNRTVENRFKEDVEALYRLYGLEGGAL